jgi:hypothetical protein
MAASPLPGAGLPGPALLGFLAGASVFRRRAFLDAGGYEPRFFLGGEETLLSYDLAERGWLMMYAPQLTVHHYPSLARDGAGRRRLLLRNALWVACLRRPLKLILNRSWMMRREPGVLVEALRGAAWVLRRRRVLSEPVEALCRRLDAAHRAQLLLLLLQRPQVRVDAAAREQLGVRAALHDAALLQDQDLVGAHDRGEAVGDDQGGAVLGDAVELGLDRPLGARIER